MQKEASTLMRERHQMIEIPLHGHFRDQARFESANNAMEGKYIIPMHVF